MKMSLKYRSVLQDVRRVVVKIGSRVLVQSNGRPDSRRMQSLVSGLTALRQTGCEVVVVSSGAIAAGMEALGMRERPGALPEQQMAAAVGQCRLMTRYDALFAKRGVKVGQVLLTHSDFHHKIRMTNARRTIEQMLRSGVVPIINENDVVADEEIKADLALGDNDLLASLVVKLIRADLLVLLTTVDGLRETPVNASRSRRIRYIENVTRKTFALVNDATSVHSKGGMASKLRAAQSAARAGCSVVIADGRKKEILKRIIAGDDVGTMIISSSV